MANRSPEQAEKGAAQPCCSQPQHLTSSGAAGEGTILIILWLLRGPSGMSHSVNHSRQHPTPWQRPCSLTSCTLPPAWEWASPEILGLLKQGLVLPCPYPRMNEFHIYVVLTGAVVSVLYLQGLSHDHPTPLSPWSHCWQSGSTQPEVVTITGVPWQGNTLEGGQAALPTTLPPQGAWCRMSLGRGVGGMQTNVGARHGLSSHECWSCIMGLLWRAGMEVQDGQVPAKGAEGPCSPREVGGIGGNAPALQKRKRLSKTLM